MAEPILPAVAGEPADGTNSGRDLPFSMELELSIQDPELIRELYSHAEGRARDEFATSALRIGVLALGQARGRIDTDAVEQACARMLHDLQSRLDHHAQGVHGRITDTLREYFDPQSGRLQDRIQRLIRKDGELENLLSRQIGGEDSQLCRTLSMHVGQGSVLMKTLSPDESQGLHKTLERNVADQLHTQRERVLREFSLDNPDGALTRLVRELTEKQGDLRQMFKDKVDGLLKEFSLDEENTALSRLVRNVETAQKRIREEFSLDNDDSAFSRLQRMLERTDRAIRDHLTLDDEGSALSRLKRELKELHTSTAEANTKFQQEVREAIARLEARRTESEKSTRHGATFEEAVGDFLASETRQRGDLCEPTGQTTGIIRNNKKGDFVITLHEECQAAGAAIVVEAKQDASYNLAKAREEIDEARRNRGASVGLFVFSTKIAPSDLGPLRRFGSDVFIAWDSENDQSDIYFYAGLSLARALCTRQHAQQTAGSVDLDSIEKAIADLETRVQNLDKIRTWTETIRNNSQHILKRLSVDQQALARHVELLNTRVAELKQVFAGEDGGD